MTSSNQALRSLAPVGLTACRGSNKNHEDMHKPGDKVKVRLSDGKIKPGVLIEVIPSLEHTHTHTHTMGCPSRQS